MSRSTRPVRAHKGSQEEEDDDEISLSDSDPEEQSDQDLEDDDDATAGDDEGAPSEEQNDNVSKDWRGVSFGALANAQDALMQESQRNTSHDRQPASAVRTDAEKVNILRDRLAELRKFKSERAENSAKNSESTPSSKPTFKQTKDHSRSSKHAPAEQTSRRAVSRYRPVIDIAQDPYHSRDPRFSSLSTGPHQLNDEKTRRNYAFLSDYRDSELSSLKASLASIKQRKNRRKSKMLTEDEDVEVEELRRNINSIENRMKSEAAKDRQSAIIRQHKKEERQKIKDGKTPYFLKNSELKERAEKERFDGMKAKEREKILDRRRKKQSQREKRAMPGQRRLPNG